MPAQRDTWLEGTRHQRAGHHLEGQPRAAVVRLLVHGFFEQRTCGVDVLLFANHEGCALGQGTRALLGAVGHGHQAFEELAQVLLRAAALEDRDQSLEGLAELRLRVDGRQIVSSSARLVARELFEHGDLVQQHGLCGGGVVALQLFTKPGNRCAGHVGVGRIDVAAFGGLEVLVIRFCDRGAYSTVQ